MDYSPFEHARPKGTPPYWQREASDEEIGAHRRLIAGQEAQAKVGKAWDLDQRKKTDGTPPAQA